MKNKIFRMAAFCLMLAVIATSIQTLSMNLYAEPVSQPPVSGTVDDHAPVSPPPASGTVDDHAPVSPPPVSGTVDDHAPVEPTASNGVVETERKFLIDVDKLPKDMAERSKKYVIVQTYINYSPEMRVRMVNKKSYYFTLKRPLDETGLSREEIDFNITKEEYETLVKKRVGSTIYKTRYQFWENGTYLFVDIYSGKLKGLAVAEIEFKSVDAAMKFTPPKWFIKDVTSDKRYKNANLAKDGMPAGKAKSSSKAA